MKKLEKAAPMPPGYLLSEEGRVLLENVRDELFLVSGFIFPATLEEQHAPLEIQRSLLGQWLENYGLRVNEVLTMMEWASRCVPQPPPRD